MKMSTTKRIIVLIFPLLATPLIVFLIAENYLSFGGGDKDIVILIPWIAWSAVFIVSGIVLWKRVSQFTPWVCKSLIYSLVIISIIWLGLLIYTVATTK